ncbi:hypothetical protein VB711_08940 [Cronbergia sp. UHCC 0137]|uniref:hypothetical protein n=1 Tax=Cronbergia sp. UHCC 0137 TaxID=3110239 RepID=UPI002B20CC05|nr:hypothetical protein [Cronbergia sp. UHCC 0137]MEA5617963.1 hypothetical protein [Cronbergia sp. UHCC 0137]
MEQELENLKKTESDKLKKQNHHLTKLKNQQLEELRSKGHSYLVYMIETVIKFLITGLNSLREIGKKLLNINRTLDIFNT